MKKFTILFLLIIISKQSKADSKTISDIARWGIPIYALGMSSQEKDNEGTKELLYSAIGAQIVSESLKIITQEKRPDYETGDKKDSFPSGHAVGAFSGAFFIHKRYGLNYAIAPYILANITAYQRVEANRHHPHDVLSGIALAGLFTYLFVDEKNEILINTNEDGNLKLEYKTKF